MGYRTLFLLPEKSPPSRGAWIEISTESDIFLSVLSPPSRGAWIEMRRAANCPTKGRVAPLAGGVD